MIGRGEQATRGMERMKTSTDPIMETQYCVRWMRAASIWVALLVGIEAERWIRGFAELVSNV